MTQAINQEDIILDTGPLVAYLKMMEEIIIKFYGIV